MAHHERDELGTAGAAVAGAAPWANSKPEVQPDRALGDSDPEAGAVHRAACAVR